MIAAVFDINLLASGYIALVNPRSTPGELVRRWEQGDFELIMSQRLSQGLLRVFQKPYFAPLVTAAERRRIDRLLRRRARYVSLTVQVSGVAADLDDDLVLSTALSGQATYLVTGDRYLQQIGQHEGVTIVSPRSFLDVLQQASLTE